MAKERSRRLAAVWFADIVGYTRLSARHEDAALAIVDEFQEASRTVVARHGGRVVKFVGDAVLTVFDSADAALKAALELRSVFREAPTAHAHACELTFGIHLGEVVEADDGDVYGDGVNVASRVQGRAGPGQILATRAVVELLRGRPEFQIRQLPPWIRLKGLGFAQLFTVAAAGEPPPPKRVPVSRAMAVGITTGVLAFIVLVVSQGFGDRGGDPAGADPGGTGTGGVVEAPALPPDFDPEIELDAATDAYFSGQLDRAAERLAPFTHSPLRETPEGEVALRYLARTHLAMGKPELAKAALEQLVATEPPMKLVLPTVDPDSLVDLYFDVRTDARRAAAGTPVVGIIVFDLRFASDGAAPEMGSLGAQVAQMLLSELDVAPDGTPYPWSVKYPWDGLAGFAGEAAYDYFADRILMSEMMPATHALFGRVAIRGGEVSLFVRVYELATGGVAASETRTAVWPDGLFAAVEEVGAALASELLEAG